ncbi:MAG: NAD(P)/FAD-dependent oxidoreductase, partial [Candidatus Aminicenantes bacterium]|nr:NAD(P)/FAD-dependent oxidoreductase [Candidatus Aminicenantes bacterium]
RLAVERFPYLRRSFDTLIETPFYGLTFLSPDLLRRALYQENKPVGYLALRSRFDDGLKRLALEAGVEFIEGNGLLKMEEEKEAVSLTLKKGDTYRVSVVIGADGAHSRVARLLSLRRCWQKQWRVVCANEDLPSSPQRVLSFYGEKPCIYVIPKFGDLTGYGWVFPKKHHICVGIGGFLKKGQSIKKLYFQLIRALQENGLLPEESIPQRVSYAIDPVGGVYSQRSLVKGRVVLVGDAAGFVSSLTGEGIYPAMVGAQCAAEVVDSAFRWGKMTDKLAEFNTQWVKVLGDYLKPPSSQRSKRLGLKLLPLLFKSRMLSRIAARVYLCGKNRALWSG